MIRTSPPKMSHQFSPADLSSRSIHQKSAGSVTEGKAGNVSSTTDQNLMLSVIIAMIAGVSVSMQRRETWFQLTS